MEKLKLSDEARKLKSEYLREWKRKNADKVRQYNIDFWERKAMEAANRESSLGRAIKNHEGESIETRVFKLHEQGFSLRDIAAKTGINHVKVSRILKTK